MKPKILVVIPFYNKVDLVISCLDSLFKSYVSGFAYQVIVFDDGSSNEELKKLQTSLNEYVGIISNGKNIGYTETSYNIVNYAKSQNFDYLLLVNNDIKFLPETFYSLVKRMNSNPNIANVGCKVLHWIDDIIIHTGTRIRNGEIINPYCGLKFNDQTTNYVERRLWNNGCCTLYNLDILRKENMNFDLEFSPAYFEESDLMTELNIKGYSVIYEPKAKVRHLLNGTVRGYPKYGKIFEDNWHRYLNKWKKYFNTNILYFQ